MKGRVSGILPVIVILVFVFIGSLVLPQRVKVQNKDISAEERNNNYENTGQDNEENIQGTQLVETLNEKPPLVIIDASHSPFGTEEKDMQDETKGEKLLKDKLDIYEYEVTYELASAIAEELEDTDIKVIILQERNREKICLAGQIVPEMSITIHIHKIPAGKTKVYYKKNSKGKEIVQNMFGQVNKHFKLERKKAEKESMLKNIDQAFMLEYSSPENITKSWIQKKARELSVGIENYFL
ncbi:MAG: hypothetical protein HFH68_00720 [Lachnospiraceae bacterium]|nr:hypothetical protein [Lachnospiraceae bacterium]